MKKLILVFSFLLVTLTSAQAKSDDNVFSKSESQNNDTSKAAASDPGAPGDPVSVDDYIPLFFLGGLGMVIYFANKNKQTV